MRSVDLIGLATTCRGGLTKTGYTAKVLALTTKSRSELYEIVEKILSTAGADAENAAITAEHLVRANLSGVDTHGVWHVGGLCRRDQKGGDCTIR